MRNVKIAARKKLKFKLKMKFRLRKKEKERLLVVVVVVVSDVCLSQSAANKLLTCCLLRAKLELKPKPKLAESKHKLWF